MTASKTTAIAAVIACALAGAALAVALLHAGPRGERGPAGAPGKASTAARLRYGICWSESTFTQDWGNGTSSFWVNGVSIDAPQYVSGVYQCPSGETFVSIVPVPAKAGS